MEVTATRGSEALGRDVLTFRRENGVAENFRTEQNRELLEKLSEETGGPLLSRRTTLAKLSDEVSYSEAGITTREIRDLWDMPVVFLLLMLLRGGRVAAAPEVGRRMRLLLLPGGFALSLAGRHALHHRRRSGRRAGLRAALHGLGADDRPGSARQPDGRRRSRRSPARRPRATACARCWSRPPARIAGPSDAFVLMLIGHGTFDGHEYKFNLPGPDITGAGAGATAEPDARRPPAGGEHDQRQRRLAGGACAKRAGS